MHMTSVSNGFIQWIHFDVCTFGSGEQQLICGVHAQDWLGVSLGYRHTLQGGCPTPFHTADRIDNAP